MLVFPKTYESYGKYVRKDAIVFVKGRLSLREERPKIIADEIIPLDQAQEKYTIGVECFAWMPHEENIKHLLDADCGLVCFQPAPNQINAMPRKMFEYMAASLPVIASNFSLWKEIIEGNKCGICVDPLNPKEIAKAIDYLIEHPQDARRMGENGRKAILEKYNWENESVKLLNLYDKLVR